MRPQLLVASRGGVDLVILLKAVRYDGQWGVVFANSWGKDWGEDGYGVLLGDKAVPYEAIRIGSVKPRSN